MCTGQNFRHSVNTGRIGERERTSWLRTSQTKRARASSLQTGPEPPICVRQSLHQSLGKFSMWEEIRDKAIMLMCACVTCKHTCLCNIKVEKQSSSKVKESRFKVEYLSLSLPPWLYPLKYDFSACLCLINQLRVFHDARLSASSTLQRKNIKR